MDFGGGVTSNQQSSSNDNNNAIQQQQQQQQQQSQQVVEEEDDEELNNSLLPSQLSTLAPTKDSSLVHAHWIVITTINSPSSGAMPKYCERMDPKWKVVVIGDTKSPDKEWHDYLSSYNSNNKNNRKNACIYLGVKEQLELPYETVKRLPFRAYTRKNLGYLYAIHHGAQYIFETDDDNELELNDVLVMDKKYQVMMLDNAMSDKHSVNVYSYFGRPDIWPRGYPLENINLTEAHTHWYNAEVRSKTVWRTVLYWVA